MPARELSSVTPQLKKDLGSRVTISVNGTDYEFSTVLLRDLCQCPACVHQFTKQKLYSTAEIPPDIQVRSICAHQSSPEAVVISWNNDIPGFDSSHATTLQPSVLESIGQSGTTPTLYQKQLPKPKSWRNISEDLQYFDFEAYAHDDAVLLKVIEQLQTWGLVFLTNVPAEEKSVSAIAERIGPVKDTFYGHTWDVRTVPQAINAAYTSNDLGFHTDLLYFQNPPHIQLLHCIQSSSSGGASVFADAFKAAAQLYETDVDAFDVLATTPVEYHYTHPESNMYTATKPVLELRPLRVGDNLYSTVATFLDAWKHSNYDDEQPKTTALDVFDCLENINWGPPFLAPFTLHQRSMERVSKSVSKNESLNQKMERWHMAARKFSDLLIQPDVLFERLMKPGDCVLFNNTRVLHSRRAFHSDDAGKARWLRGTYVDRDPFFSKLRVLRESISNY